jgi:polyphenol oxidase
VLLQRGSLGPAQHAVTDRRGGTSRAPYDSLNLGDHVGDDPAAVAANRELLAQELGLAPEALAFMRQVHGRDIAVVGPVPGEPPEADGLVTRAPGVALVVLVADCVPILLAAPGSDGVVLGAAHAGRKGVQAGVVPATVQAMRRLGAQVDELVAHVGPAVCGRCYEVPPALQDEIVALAPQAHATTRSGTPGLDLPRAVLNQLTAAGVRHPAHDETCTLETPSLYSHRRDGVTGRFAGVVWTSP